MMGTAGREDRMQKWEYLVEHWEPTTSYSKGGVVDSARLSALGAEGWELVAYDEVRGLLFYKRPTQ